MEAKEQDLVMLRLQGWGGYTNVWFRVMFIDNDGTFIGRCEKREWDQDDYFKLGEDSRFDFDKILHIHQEGEQFCYSNGVTICECKGLCKENM